MLTRIVGCCLAAMPLIALAQTPKPLSVFGVQVSLTQDCQLLFERGSHSQLVALELDPQGRCRIVSHDQTNVPQLVYANGMYVLIAESNVGAGENCRSEYRGIGIAREGPPKLSPKRRSATCHSARDMSEFGYLANQMQPVPHSRGNAGGTGPDL